jgi:hypothetical protein
VKNIAAAQHEHNTAAPNEREWNDVYANLGSTKSGRAVRKTPDGESSRRFAVPKITKSAKKAET